MSHTTSPIARQAFYTIMNNIVIETFTDFWAVQNKCLSSLPTAQYNTLSFLRYLGPLFLTVVGTHFVIAILIGAFSNLKATVRNVSGIRSGVYFLTPS